MRKNIICGVIGAAAGVAAVWSLDHWTMPPHGASGAFVGAVIGYLFGGVSLAVFFLARAILPSRI